jgi:hypothetical protein
VTLSAPPHGRPFRIASRRLPLAWTLVAAATAALGTSVSLAGCTPQGEYPSRLTAGEDRQAKAGTASAAAAALSIQNAGTLDGGSDYSRAIKCAAAAAIVLDRVRHSPLAGQAEIDPFTQASRLFQERVRTLAPGEGKTPAESASELKRAIAIQGEDPAVQGTTLVACIRTLQQT